jgi:phosphoribosylformylglycinamidine synthase
MLLAISPEKVEKVLKIFQDEQVEATIIGKYNESRVATLYYKGHIIADLNLQKLFNPPQLRRRTNWKPPRLKEPTIPYPQDLEIILLKLLSSYNIASKEKVVRRYDQEVKGQTVIKPLQGWLAGPNDGSVLKPMDDNWQGVAISCGINPRYGKINPYWMAASVIDEAVRNNVCVGGRRWALLDNFTWGNPEYEDRLGGLVYASRGCYDTAKIYRTPFVSGKDSLYNEGPLGSVAPTLLITALGIVPDIRNAITMDLKRQGNKLYLLGLTSPELGGSAYYHLNGELGASVPKLAPEKTIILYRNLLKAIDSGLVRACHDCSEGGLGVALAEMAFTGNLGAELNLKRVPVTKEMRADFILFSESNGRLLVEVEENKAADFEAKMGKSDFACIGRVKPEKRLHIINGKVPLIDLELDELISAWKLPLEAPRK